MDIYIKPVAKAMIKCKKTIYLKDIAEVYADAETSKKAKNTVIFHISEQPKKNYLISIIDIVKKVSEEIPNCSIQNVGETDVVIEYEKEDKKDNPVWKWVKVLFVSFLLAVGSATALMSFHSDADLPVIFTNYYKIFFGVEIDNPMLITIPYSIGLVLGIIVFFNHVLGKKLTDDPTPLEVEMSKYETDVSNTLVSMLNTEKNNHKKGVTDNDYYS